MHADRISIALSRIEAAALRIRDAAQPPHRAGETDHGARYEALRREAASALAELDELIAGLES